MERDQLRKPGCFGAASMFSSDSSICQRCPVFAECQKVSIEHLQTLRKGMNVDDLLKRHRAAMTKVEDVVEPEIEAVAPNLFAEAGRAALAKVKSKPASLKPDDTGKIARTTKQEKTALSILPEHQVILDAIPQKKPKHEATSLCKSGSMALLTKSWPTGKLEYNEPIQKWFRLAITKLNEGGFTRKELASDFVEAFKWAQSAATSHVSIAVPILIAFGFAQEVNRQVKPLRS
jgi:hypothetical protein